MRRSSGFRSGRERVVLLVVGFAVVVVVCVGMVWLGYALGKRQPADTQPPATASVIASPLPSPTVGSLIPTLTPTITPLPTATPIPTPAPPTNTPPPPMIQAGPNGLNIRSGPDIDYTRLAHVEPGTQFRVIGRYDDWWQIDYNGLPAWAFSGVVTAYNTDSVPEVQPALP